MSRFVAALVAGGMLLAAPLAADPLSLSDVFELEWASDPQIAPDGNRIVYVRNFMDRMTDQRRSHLWSIGLTDDHHRPLTSGAGNYRAPRFSPDGQRLAYVGADGDVAQLHVRFLDSGQTIQVTRLRNPPRYPVWSPRGDQIAFLKFVPLRAAPLTQLPTPPEGAEWAPPPRVVDRLVYRSDGQGYLGYGYQHLFVVPAEGGTARQLTRGAYNLDGQPAWLPDGSALVVAGNRHADWETDPLNSELYQVTLDTGRVTALTDRQGPDLAPTVSPDGRQIAYLGFDDQLQSFQILKLYVLDRASGTSRLIDTGLDRSLSGVAWEPRGRRLLAQYDDRGTSVVARVTLDGRVTPLVNDLGGTSIGRPYPGGSFSAAANGSLAYVRTDVNRPADVAVLRRGTHRRLTDLNGDLLGQRDLPTVRELTWESSADERAVQGWLLLPPGFDRERRYPLVLEIHGGPFQNYGPRFGAELQLYAAAGYVVLFANPRGSTSYGQAFAGLIHHNYPGEDVDDLLAGVDAAVALGFVDPERLFVTGGSGGGTLTSWIVGETNRFRAAVVQKPVINWTSFVLTTDDTNFYYKYWFPDPPWRAPDHYFRRSPLSLVDQVTTPTMLLTGEADLRTPISEAEQYYQALKLRGVESVLVRLPGASHGISNRPSQLQAKVAYVLAWFERFDGAARP